MPDITVRFAETDQDVVAIHGFLCVVAGPNLPGAIDPKKSATEVWRVANNECALMAIHQGSGKLVGSLGIIKPDFWWGEDGNSFLVNRWFFALPGLGAGKLLLEQGIAIAKDAGLELHIIDERRGRLKIFNRDPRRDAVNPYLSSPVRATHETSRILQ